MWGVVPLRLSSHNRFPALPAYVLWFLLITVIVLRFPIVGIIMKNKSENVIFLGKVIGGGGVVILVFFEGLPLSFMCTVGGVESAISVPRIILSSLLQC